MYCILQNDENCVESVIGFLKDPKKFKSKIIKLIGDQYNHRLMDRVSYEQICNNACFYPGNYLLNNVSEIELVRKELIIKKGICYNSQCFETRSIFLWNLISYDNAINKKPIVTPKRNNNMPIYFDSNLRVNSKVNNDVTPTSESMFIREEYNVITDTKIVTPSLKTKGIIPSDKTLMTGQSKLVLSGETPSSLAELIPQGESLIAEQSKLVLSRESLKDFNLNNMIPYHRSIIYGEGKVIMENIIKNIPDLDKLFIISPNNDLTYAESFPDAYIDIEYSSDLIVHVLNYCKLKIADRRSDRVCIVIDECFSKEMLKDQLFKEMLFNCRHYRLYVIIISSSHLRIPPEFRTQIDYVFLNKETLIPDFNFEKIYSEYFSAFPDTESFVSCLNQIAAYDEIMVADNYTSDGTVYKYAIQ